jgi:hypothetical protein
MALAHLPLFETAKLDRIFRSAIDVPGVGISPLPPDS